MEFTREPSPRGTKLYGPFGSAAGLRGAIQVLQKIFKFRTCSLDIQEQDERWQWFRPCLLHAIGQCTAPCNFRISKEEYRKEIRRLEKFLEGKKQDLLLEMREEMTAAATELRFEEAARLRDELHLLEMLDERGELDTHVQPEVFPIDPKKGLASLQRTLNLHKPPRVIEGVDIADLQGTETVASLVQFLDGLPFKPGYRHYRIRQVEGVDDFAAIHEVVGAAVSAAFQEVQCSQSVANRRRQGTTARRTGRLLGDQRSAADGPLAGQTRGGSLRHERRRAAPPGPALVRSPPIAVRAGRGPPLRPTLPPYLKAKIDPGRLIRADAESCVQRSAGRLGALVLAIAANR